MLDQELEPWIIEINLSPACSERADFLTQMLDDHSLDMLNYLQSRILLANEKNHWAPGEIKDKYKRAYASRHAYTTT